MRLEERQSYLEKRHLSTYDVTQMYRCNFILTREYGDASGRADEQTHQSKTNEDKREQ